MTVEQDGDLAVRSRFRGWRVGLAVAAVFLMVLVFFGWWAGRQGYVSWFGTACTSQGFDPVPSYDDLVSKYGYSPYCARSLRGQTWF